MIRKVLLGAVLLFCGHHLSVAQGTATNFNVTDCSGATHDLFQNLDTGKVVVLTWVMPCVTCIGPTKSVHSTVQSYSASKPGKVVHFVADDYANTSCNTLKSWLATNGIAPTTTLVNAAIKMTDYGTNGMPKTVVLGGTNHAVFFNENNTINTQNLKNAIDAALAANVVTTTVPSGIPGVSGTDLRPHLYPVIARGETRLFYSSQAAEIPAFEILNSLGARVYHSEPGTADQSGSVLIKLDGLPPGFYYLRLTENKRTARFIVLE